MKDFDRKLDQALSHAPDYSRLDTLSQDVWNTIRLARNQKQSAWSFPLHLKASTLVLGLLAVLALSQVSFKSARHQADIFDLRYFSYQSVPSLNLTSLYTYEGMP